MAAIVDFHCHLDLYSDPEGAIAEAVESDAYVLSVTTTPSAWRGTSARAASGRRIRTALGIHPQLAHEREHEASLFEALLPEARYVGEIGLDGSREYRVHADAQRRVFERVLRACDRAGGRVMSVHTRGAAGEVLDLLAKHAGAGVAILHWFTGSKTELRRAVDLGCWFSVGPAMLATQSGRTLISAMPRERVLTETDGPFAKSGGRVLRPAEVGPAVNGLTELWQTDSTHVRETVAGNLRHILRQSGSAHDGVSDPKPTTTR